MSALPDDVIVADEPTSTFQPEENDPNTVVTSSEPSAHGDIIDDTTSSAEDVAVGAQCLPVAGDNDDSGLTTVSDGTLAVGTFADVLNVVRVTLLACSYCEPNPFLEQRGR